MIINIIKVFILAFVSYAWIQVISNQNKRIGIMGAILISCSSAVIGYCSQGITEALIFGQIILFSLDRILGKYDNKNLAILAMFIGILGYGLFTNISFQISFAFAIVPFIIWIIIKNRKEVNLNKKQVILLAIAIISAFALIIGFYKYQTISSLENENGLVYLMSYVYSPMAVFNQEIKFVDSNAITGIMSVFPVVLILSIYYVYKYEKHFEFLAPTIICSVLGILSIVSEKIIFESIVPNYVMAIGVELIQLYMMLYIFSNVEEKICTLLKSAYVSLITIVFVFIVKFPEIISGLDQKYIPAIIIVMESFICLNYSDKRFVKLASVLFPAIVLFESLGRLIVNFI